MSTPRKQPQLTEHPAYSVLQHFVANLYTSAPHLEIEEYRDWALDEVRHLVPFDAALWGTGNAQTEKFHSLTLLGLKPAFVVDLMRHREDNPLYTVLIEEPGRSVRMNELIKDGSFYRSNLYKKCFRKHRVERILSTRNVDARSGLSSLITLYRFDREQPFTEEEAQLQQVIAYHLGKAATHAFFLHISRPDARLGSQRGAAVVDRHGVFHEAENGFLDLLDKYFPDREPSVLPFELPAEESSFEAQGLLVQSSHLADLVLVRIREATPLDQLTPRERQVVEGVCQGLSHKEIGRELGLAPTTVSSHLYRAYEKLGVASKTALSRLIRGANLLTGQH